MPRALGTCPGSLSKPLPERSGTASRSRYGNCFIAMARPWQSNAHSRFYFCDDLLALLPVTGVQTGVTGQSPSTEQVGGGAYQASHRRRVDMAYDRKLTDRGTGFQYHTSTSRLLTTALAPARIFSDLHHGGMNPAKPLWSLREHHPYTGH